MLQRHDSAALYAVIAVLLTATLIVDLRAQLGVAVWVFYIAAQAVSLHSVRPATPLVTGIVAAVLTVVGYFLSTPSEVAEVNRMAPVNRGFIIVVFLVFAFIGRQFVVNRLRLLQEDALKSAQTGLSACMQGEQGLEELGDKVLSYLARTVNAQVGSLYVAHDDGTLMRCAAFACERGPGAPRERVRPGEDLIGQAAKEQRILVVDDVPDGYVQVRSGVGAAKPRALVLVPTGADREVNGVVELGLFRAPSPEVQTFLDLAARLVGIAIRSAQYRLRQAELLEETQRQAAELQTQQHELQALNEELGEQTRALETSYRELQDQQGRLEESNAQLKEQALTLETQKAHLSATQEMLQRKAMELERASRYKSEFLANMSHELRTPLNSALILAKLLMDNRRGTLEPEQVQWAASIYKAGNDLLVLINDILDLSKIEAGKLETSFESVDVARLFEDLRQRFDSLASEKRLALSVSVEAGCPVTLQTDPQRLQQILTNLLSNAVKFTDRGTVRLRALAGSPGQVLFQVEDTGIGVAPEAHQVIFEAFRQADGSTNRKHGGTGLGLSISRELADLLGGSIGLQSQPGQGATFTLALPVQRRLATPERAGATSESSAGVVARVRPRPAADAMPLVAEDDRDALSDASRAVLVIEDDLVFAGILRDLSHELGFQCIIAPGADEGLRLARALHPVAIILDIGLPDHSGLAVLELLKRDASVRHIPVHVVSVHDYQQVARKMGVVGYALKPVRREELVAAFRALEQQLARAARAVLVVEDDALQAKAIAQLLESEKVDITCAATAEEALGLLEARTFDCMVLDLMLPGTSGFDLLERLALQRSSAVPPVIVYTARALTLEEEQRLRRHAKSIVIKGARSPDRLLEEVTLFLHQMERELPDDKRQLLRTALGREAAFLGRRILVVEDDVRNVFALSSALEPKGAIVEIARNGREALQRVQAEPPLDLVLMDIMMPEMDGLTATREIRRLPRAAQLPIIALTAKAMPDDREQCLVAGANDYIAKPVDIEKLSLARVWMVR